MHSNPLPMTKAKSQVHLKAALSHGVPLPVIRIRKKMVWQNHSHLSLDWEQMQLLRL